jgi:PsbN protein
LFTNLAKLMQTLSSAPDPAVSVAVSILAVLLALTGFGLWTAFGPKAAKLTDPWDDHDD